MSNLNSPLFILEMANNHMGDVRHGAAIIRAFGKIARQYPFRFAFKFQYRDLDTYIHPAFQDREDLKYVKRFKEARLNEAEFKALLVVMKEEGFEAICTPFDEPSVQKIVEHGFDVIKIASCSLTDWPLLEAIAKAGKPVIASTAGSSIEDIDRVVSFLQHRNIQFSLLHCVAEYPTEDAGLQLNQIDLLRGRYPGVPVGYSTHEHPDNRTGVVVALAKGASIFEKHVGMATEQWPLNLYSASPEQVDAWLAAAADALRMCGTQSGRYTPSKVELDSLNSLRRGVFVRNEVPGGKKIGSDDVFFAFPPEPGQLLANDWSKYAEYQLLQGLKAGDALRKDNVVFQDSRQQIYGIAQRVKALLAQGHVVVPGGAELEISHHYGLERFDAYGLTMITVVNREYCKKLLVLLPGQTHPEQYHQQKEETFHVLHGTAEIQLDGEVRTVKAGDVVTVPCGVRHAFSSATGSVFEEISTTHHKNDSFYTDAAIQANPNRKTFLKYWLD
ncbi:N-acetylneuraminate synthase family protein [Chitinimonas sp.]|uniref:N-acetylneuraminate synthase family protein n=1 Tax=Chitinimonas sp. TaxID=1934313 RepID=UPI002F931185